MMLRDRGLGVEAPVGELLVRVGFPLGLTVYEELAAPDRYFVSRQSDDPLDQVLIAVVDTLEDDDVPTMWGCKTVDELVYEHPVTDLERRDHAPRGNPEGLHDERPDETEDQREGDEQYDQVLERTSSLPGGRPALLA